MTEDTHPAQTRPAKRLLVKHSRVHAFQVPPGEHVKVDPVSAGKGYDWVVHNETTEDPTWIITDDYKRAHYEDHGELAAHADAGTAAADPNAEQPRPEQVNADSLEAYFRDVFNQLSWPDYAVRIEVQPEGVRFIIHPQGVDGPTADFMVNGDTTRRIHPPGVGG